MADSGTASPASATLQERLLARAIDVAVLISVDVLLGWLIGFGWQWLATGSSIVLAYFALFDSMLGATPGKMKMGLRVVSVAGGRPSVTQSLVREAFTVVGAIPFVGPLLAFAAWFWIVKTIRESPLQQGVHDVMAGTRVVRG